MSGINNRIIILLGSFTARDVEAVNAARERMHEMDLSDIETRILAHHNSIEDLPVPELVTHTKGPVKRRGKGKNKRW